MIPTWQSFFENKESIKKKIEKAEEELGMDLDDDGEKGESKAHREKVLGKGKKKDDCGCC